MRTEYVIDDYQQSYFVIDSFQALLDACYGDFGALYDRLKRQEDIAAPALIETDQVIHRGTMDYFNGVASPS